VRFVGEVGSVVEQKADGAEARIPRFRAATPATATVLGALVLLLEAGAMTLDGFAHRLSLSNDVPPAVLVVIYTVVGVVVARRQPRNPVGWVLIVAILLFLLSNDVGSYAGLRYQLGHHGLPFAPVAVLLEAVWVPSIALFPLVVLLFPDGRLRSRRWRWVLSAYVGLIALVTAITFLPALSAVVHHHIRVDSSGNLISSGKSSGGAGSVLAALVVCSIGAIWVSFVAHQFLSWRRSTGERRQQLKWVMCGAAIALVSGVLGSVFNTSGAGSALFFGIVALPVSIGVAILKYRLYEIDRFVSRTLAYAIVTGLVVGVYVGVVTLVTKGLGFSSPIAVAASTLAAAALFNPLRHRVQRVVDRRFNRAHYDAEATVAAFTARLRDAVDLETVRSELLEVVNRAVEPAHASVWIKGRL
jgi:hypothetical protein